MTLKLDRGDLKTKLLWAFIYRGLRIYGERLLKSKGIGFADRVYGLLQTGRMTESYLLGLIPQIKADVVEIYSHPAIAIAGEPSNGPLGNGTKELATLVSDRVREALLYSGFELTNYNNPEVIAALK